MSPRAPALRPCAHAAHRPRSGMHSLLRQPALWNHAKRSSLAAAGLSLLLLGGCGGGTSGISRSAHPAASGAAPAPLVVDDFEDLSGWSAHPADGVELSLRPDDGWRGKSMRLDFRFLKGGGYAVARKAFSLDLPENYAFTFHLRGRALPNHLEFKLIDSTGENVWWSVRRDLQFPESWQVFTVKRRQIQFAWGPQGGGEIRHAAAIELAVTAGSGGAGSVWIDEMELKPLPPVEAAPPPPIASASSSKAGHGSGSGTDGDPETFWESAGDDRRPWFALDLKGPREFGGLIIDWAPGRFAADYAVEISDQGASWQTLRTVRAGNGGRDYIYLPETEAAFLRVRVLEKPIPAVAIRELRLQPLQWSATRESFFQAIARDAPRGSYPRGMSGEQSYWTVVGVDGDGRECLMNEDGMLETGKAACSIEPFLYLDDRLVSWADVRSEQRLLDQSLPLPSVEWTWGRLHLSILAFGTGQAGASGVVARYRLENRGAQAVSAKLFLALRPFQVNPPTQFLNTPGGTALIRKVAADSSTLTINGDRRVVCLTRPAGFGAVPFDGGDIVVDYLRSGHLPLQTAVQDSFGAASGALAFSFDLPPGSSREAAILIPLYKETLVPEPFKDGAAASWLDQRARTAAELWRGQMKQVDLHLPFQGADLLRESISAQLGYILVNRAGPAIQPGARAYARSWIRDGALTSSALLRLGHPESVKAFIEWFAPYQYGNGKVPCVVDARGADPVPEHDSSGEFIFLIAEYYRYTRDRALLAEMWPRVLRAASYLDSLRGERRTPEYLTPEKRRFYGLLPPSISHEGYSAKPMHSYWDDFFALRGFQDAAYLAGELDRDADRTRLSAIRDQFRADLAASVKESMEAHKIDFVPGCADLGDFDATSTTIALSPEDGLAFLPRQALERTFQRYYDFFVARRDSQPWEAYTPYEMRNLGAFVRLGWRDRAQELLKFFLSYQRPAGWRQWAEVVWKDERAPHFIGDMPHTWVGSDFVRSALDMLAYTRDSDEAIVLGAGLSQSSLCAEGGVSVRGLCTPYGNLSYAMAQRGDTLRARIEEGLKVPPGGLVLLPPLPCPAPRITLNGRPLKMGPEGEVVVRQLPATLVYAPRPAKAR